jgi:hypothetical protein
VRATRRAQPKRAGDHGQRHEPERQIDVEDPAPGQLIDEEAAEQRPDQSRQAPNAAEQPLIAPPLARRNEIADHRDRRHHQAAAADPLHEAEGDELDHVAAQAASSRPRQEHHDRRLQDDLPSVEIAELAVDRRDDGRGEKIRRDDPGEVGQAAQLADNGGQRGRDDRLVERREQQNQHQCGERRPNRSRRCCGLRGLGAHGVIVERTISRRRVTIAGEGSGGRKKRAAAIPDGQRNIVTWNPVASARAQEMQ